WAGTTLIQMHDAVKSGVDWRRLEVCTAGDDSMSRISVALTVILAFVASSGVVAQARPDFTGKWVLNYERSGRGISGNSPDVVFASQLDITQTATDLSVKRSSVRQAPFS